MYRKFFILFCFLMTIITIGYAHEGHELDEVAHARETGEHSSPMVEMLQSDNQTPGLILFAIGLSFVLGAGHALSPGHGKGMVAAYLIGTKGKVKDAVILGSVVTFTHVFSVILLGLVALFLSHVILPEQLFPWLALISGLMVFGVGARMLYNRIKGKDDHHHHHHDHSHTHDHSHDHDHSHVHDHHHHHDHHHEDSHEHAHSHASDKSHSHDHHHDHSHDAHNHDHDHDHHHGHGHHHGHSHSHVPKGEVTLKSLISLGIAGGMVPCPAALVVLLISISLQQIVFGLAMIVVFSMGLAAVLIGLGILTVKASSLLGGFDEKRKWIKVLPVFSSCAVMVIGTIVIGRALFEAGLFTSGS